MGYLLGRGIDNVITAPFCHLTGTQFVVVGVFNENKILQTYPNFL